MKKTRLLKEVIPPLLVIWVLTLMSGEVWARAGGGRSGGFRGSRTFSAPRYPSPSPGVQAYPRTGPGPYGNPGGFARPQSPYAQPGGSPFLRGLAGGLAGGFLGSLLFGGFGRAAAPGWGGGRGGLGFLDILLLLVLGYFLLRFIRHRGKRVLPGESPSGEGRSAFSGTESVAQTFPSASGEVERGLAHIRSLDPSFDPDAFKEWVQDLFFRIQAAWGNQDLSPVRVYLTPEMEEIFSRDLEEQKRNNRVNRLENIAVRSVEISEVWQEQGNDFITVLFYANLLDYVVDRQSGEVVSGSKTEPVKFREFWTFTRPAGGGSWKLSAIQQEG